MSEWRPDGWENPSTEEYLEAHGWRLDKTTLRWLKPDGDGHDLIPYDVSVERRYAYEAGADAIVAALKEGGVYGQYTEGIYEGPWIVGDDGTYFDISDVVSDENKKGYLVFIPDKE